MLHPPLLGLSLIIAGCCFSYIGLLFSAPPADVPGNVMMLSAVVKFSLIFISGIFVLLSRLPAWGRAISYVSPLTYFADVLRLCLGEEYVLGLKVDLLALTAFVGLSACAASVFHRLSLPKRF